MPKLIDYPRTTYASAWEVAEVVDDTGGKCALETCARKLNRKVSGSFKAIIGSAVKFGLLTSKRELLSTTTLFRRIKHAYDKQEEVLFHREAFLTPPLFTQLCRKFRQRELPVQMLDVMLIREFDVEEINAPAVAKAFAEGARAVGLLDEHNIVADIDHLAAQNPPRRELASPIPGLNSFRANTPPQASAPDALELDESPVAAPPIAAAPRTEAATPAEAEDAVAALFNLHSPAADRPSPPPRPATPPKPATTAPPERPASAASATREPTATTTDAPAVARPLVAVQPSPPVQPQNPAPALTEFVVRISGPGIDTQLTIADEDDLILVQALLEKIKRRLRA